LVLISSSCIDEGVQSQTVDVLLQTAWDVNSREDLVKVKEILCQALDVECFKPLVSRAAKQAQKKDELDSYESLVREAGK
jgi:hypothetical protein